MLILFAEVGRTLVATSFYGHLKSGKSKVQALQATQSDTLKEYPALRRWAALVLVGDPGYRNQSFGITMGSVAVPCISGYSYIPWKFREERTLYSYSSTFQVVALAARPVHPLGLL